MLGEDDYYLRNGDLFFPLRNYLPDITATKRIFLFCRRRRGQFESKLTPIKRRAGWQLRLGELSIGKISACAKQGARAMGYPSVQAENRLSIPGPASVWVG